MNMRKIYLLAILLFAVISLNFAACSTTSDSTGAISSSELVRKEPYLVYTGNNTAMTVAWQTLETPVDCYIEWGEVTGKENRDSVTQTGSNANEHQFFYTITGLKPGTKIFYNVNIDGLTYSGSFRTAPSGTAENLTFYAYGDTRSNPAMQDIITTRIMADMAKNPEERQTFITHSGDFTTDGMQESFWDKEYFNRNYPGTIQLLASLPILGACGNHETYSSQYVNDPEHYGYLLRKYWPYSFLKEKNHCYYSADYGPVHIAVLDQYTTDYTEGSDQYNWLKSDLENSSKPWKFVLFHIPAWSAAAEYGKDKSKSSHADDEIIQKYYHPIFLQNNVKAVFQGHQHFYSRCSVDGISYLTLGGGGAPLTTPDPNAPYVEKALSIYHFSRIDIQGKTMNISVMDENGNEVDSVKAEL